MPEELIALESRIFHIGRECYVVYLGSERDDIRPFLRIGNTRDIPEEIHNAVGTTVVTDNHVGNPLLEILDSPKAHCRYLGDTGVVAAIRRFFESFQLPTDEVTDYHKVKDGEMRHMVWFYTSGNIHMRFDNRIIFDLGKREKEDRHFVRLYEEAKSEFLRNPLRYIRRDFNNPGVVLSDGSAFWYEGGNLISLETRPDFFAGLMSRGIDPDFIDSFAYNLTSDEMGSGAAAAFINFVKRTRQRRKQVRILTANPELLRKVKHLFPERGSVPAAIEAADVSGGKKATFRESIFSLKNSAWHIHRAGLPDIAAGRNSPNHVSINPAEGRISIPGPDGPVVFTPPVGFPIDFPGAECPAGEGVDKYFFHILNHVKTHLSKDEIQVCTDLDRLLHILRDELTTPDTQPPSLKQTIAAVCDGLRRCGRSGGVLWFLLSNALVLLNTMTPEGAVSRAVDTVRSSLAGTMDKLGAPRDILPFWGSLFLGGRPHILWHVTKRGFSTADIAAAEDVNRRIAAVSRPNEAAWHDDQERLLKLVRSLSKGGSGPLTAEELALLGEVPKSRRPAEPQRREPPRKTQPAPARSSSQPQKQSPPKVTPPAAQNRPQPPSLKRRSGSGAKASIIAGAALLLPLIGFLGWDLSGRAPWGRVLGSSVDTPFVSNLPDSADSAESAPDVSEDDSSMDTETPISETTDDSAGGSSVPEPVISETPETAAEPAVIDINRAPGNRAEADAYLDVEGRIDITEADIHLAANEIAVLNGYKDLDFRVYTGEDPDWIYPDSTLNLPDGRTYTIRRGDTIWFLAAREVRTTVMRELRAYDEAVAVLQDAGADTASRQSALNSLDTIAGESGAAAMRRLAASAKNNS